MALALRLGLASMHGDGDGDDASGYRRGRGEGHGCTVALLYFCSSDISPITVVQVTLLWAQVVLGDCKDFGACCASDRGDKHASIAGKKKRLEDDWPELQ